MEIPLIWGKLMLFFFGQERNLFWSCSLGKYVHFEDYRSFLGGLVKKKLRKGDGDDLLDELTVLRAGRDAEYVDIKTASLSDSESALKLVFPISER